MRAASCCPSSATILLSIVLLALRMLRSSQHGMVQVAAQDMSRTTTVAPTKPCKCKKGKDGITPSFEPCGSSKTELECALDQSARWCALTSTCDPPGDDSCDKAECEQQDSASTGSYLWCALTRTCNAPGDPCEETPPTPAPSLIPSIAQEEIVMDEVEIDQLQPEALGGDDNSQVDESGSFVESDDRCPPSLAFCAEVSPCYDHNVGICGEDGVIVSDDCATAVQVCNPCFPNSRCGTLGVEEDGSSTFVESESCTPDFASCADAAVCYDHTLGLCAEDGTMSDPSCAAAVPFCDTCFPNSRCGTLTRTQPPTSAPTLLSSTTYLHPTFFPTTYLPTSTTYLPTSYATTFGPTTTFVPTWSETNSNTFPAAAVVIVRPVNTTIDSRESSYDDCDGGALLCSPLKTAALIIGILLLILLLLLCCCYQYYYKVQQQQQQRERDAAEAEQRKNDELELDTSDDSSNGQNPDDGSTNTATLQFARRLVDYVVTIKSSRSGRKSQVKTASHRCTSPNCLICAKKRKAMLSIPEQYDLQQTQKEQREELERQKDLRMGKCAIVPDYDEESTIHNDGFVSAVYESDTDTEYDRIDNDVYDRNSDTNRSSTESDNDVSTDNMDSC